jgi:spore coat polysaccharide biosynthesis protein SpsF
MLAIIQARFSSQRLPGKVLKPLVNLPLLGWTVQRLQQCECLSAIVLATSDTVTDDSVAEYGQKLGLEVYRGSLNDVATRFCQVVTARRVDAFVRVCGDSPLIDPTLVDEAIALYHRHDCDLVTNVFPRSFPKGQSVEVIRSNPFLRVRDQVPLSQREHITQVYYQNPEQFHIVNFSSDLEAAAIQLSVDTWDDYDHMQNLIQACAGKPGGWRALMALKKQLYGEIASA